MRCARTELGFTLLEILIAVMITAMLVATAVSASRQLHRVQAEAVRDHDRSRTARILLDRLERELAGAMLLARDPNETGDTRLDHPWLFFGDDRVFATNDSDALRFITRSPAGAPGQTGGGIRLVTYAVESVDERYDLLRSEGPLPRQLEKSLDVPDAQTAVEDVYRFSLRYRDDEGGAGWVDAWDSTDVAQLDRLPAAVEIGVQLVEEQPDGSFVASELHTRVVTLPLRPIVPGAPAGEGECADGMSVLACTSRFDKRLSGANADLRQLLLPLLGRVGKRCWADVRETPEGDELRAILADLGNLDQECSK